MRPHVPPILRNAPISACSGDAFLAVVRLGARQAQGGYVTLWLDSCPALLWLSYRQGTGNLDKVVGQLQ